MVGHLEWDECVLVWAPGTGECCKFTALRVRFLARGQMEMDLFHHNREKEWQIKVYVRPASLIAGSWVSSTLMVFFPIKQKIRSCAPRDWLGNYFKTFQKVYRNIHIYFSFSGVRDQTQKLANMHTLPLSYMPGPHLPTVPQPGSWRLNPWCSMK